MQLERRGFFPKGGGRIVIHLPAQPAETCLEAFSLQDRGDVLSVAVHAFTAGRVHRSKGERMVSAAVATFKKVGICLEVN